MAQKIIDKHYLLKNWEELTSKQKLEVCKEINKTESYINKVIFWENLSAEEQLKLCKDVDKTQSYIKSVMYEFNVCGALTALRISKETNNKIRFTDLRPDILF